MTPTEHPGTQTIETGRLRLRRFRMEDAEAVFRNWTNDPVVCRYLAWDPHGTVEVTREVLMRWIARYESPSAYIWCVALRETDEPIGALEFVGMSEKNRWAEVGYCLSHAWWNKGIMTEALRGVLEFAFTLTPFHRIESRHSTQNPASGRVMEKAGMVYEGTQRQRTLVRGAFHDSKVYGLVREDWSVQNG